MSRVARIGAAGACVFVLGASDALAQSAYPSRPIRMLVPTSAGGGTDFVARIIGQKMTDTWQQQVVVENRGGAGGIIATEILAKAPPDGHTLMTMSNNHVVNASLYSKLPYDTIKDFAGITLVAGIPAVLVVGPTLGVKTPRELIALAKSKPGQLNFGSPGSGTGGHLNAEQFKLTAGIDVVHVPFKGTPEALTGLLGGSVQYCIAPVTAVQPLVQSGRLVPLAVTTKSRTPLMPDLPTLSESALPGYDFNLWVGLLAPARTPDSVKQKLAAEIQRIARLSDVRERLLTQGATPNTSSPADFDAFMKTEVASYAKLVKASGAKVD